MERECMSVRSTYNCVGRVQVTFICVKHIRYDRTILYILIFPTSQTDLVAQYNIL